MKRFHFKLVLALAVLLSLTFLQATSSSAQFGKINTGIDHLVPCNHESFKEGSGSPRRDESFESIECTCCDCAHYCSSGHEIPAESDVSEADTFFDPSSFYDCLSPLTISSSQAPEHPPKRLS
jgi:hypothetical protein